MKKQMNLRAAVLSLAMAAMLALPTMASAQGSRSAHGGLFGTAEQAYNDQGLMGANGTRGTGQLTNQTFGGGSGTGSNDEITAPLGTGIAILLLAGAGYVALKKKED